MNTKHLVVVNSNVILRFLLGDHSNHSARSRKFFEKAAAGEYQIILSEVVIARKISFGSQSDEGLKTREVLMTVLGTMKKRYPQYILGKFVSFLNQYATNPNLDPYQVLFNDSS